MRFSDCVVGACLVAAAHALPACPAVPPPASTTTTSVTGVASSSTTSAASAGTPSPSSKGAKPSSTTAAATSAASVSSYPSSSSSASTTIVTSSSVKPTQQSTAPATTSSASPPKSTAWARAYPADIVDKLRDSSFSKLEQFSAKSNFAGGCTLENAAVRHEWSDLSVPQREEYIAAVKCLMGKPSKMSRSDAPGARSRYDDFLATHIQQTPTIHTTANFLGWHRYYTWAFEQALRQECGYTGYLPYWNWDRYAKDPANSPLFNGNASSLSGNSPRPGACINTGPFADVKINLGPGSSLKYNPRCITRNIDKGQAAQTTADKTYSLITRSSNIVSFQSTMQAVPGVHEAGHFTVGGDPGGDIYSSPGDPYFYLHHAMIDRVWWIWQMQDLQTRLSSVGGNTGPWGSGRPGSLDDMVNVGVNGASVKLGSLLNTLGGKGGEFCYIYY